MGWANKKCPTLKAMLNEIGLICILSQGLT
jgi:hypothetical protein